MGDPFFVIDTLSDGISAARDLRFPPAHEPIVFKKAPDYTVE